MTTIPQPDLILVHVFLLEHFRLLKTIIQKRKKDEQKKKQLVS